MMNSITLDAIRQVYRTAISTESLPQDKNNKDSIQKLLRQSGVPKDVLQDLMLELESERPFRHVFFSRWTGNFGSIRNNAEALKGTDIQIQGLPGISNLKCDYVKIDPKYVVLTFSHDAASTYWEWQDGGRYPVNVTVRHPFTTYLFNDNLLISSFPGFTKSRDIEEDVEYYDILKVILQRLRDSMSIDYRPFAVKRAIETFLSEDLKRVKFVRIKSEHELGGMEFISNSNNMSIENLLPGLMVPFLPPGISEEQVKYAMINAIKECNISSSVLFWQEEAIATKIRYFDFGAELYVTWTGTEPEYSKVFSVIEFLRFITLKFETNSSSILEFFVKDKSQRIFTKSEIAATVAFEASALDTELVGLMAQRVLEPRYRLNTPNQFVDYQNSWVTNPTSLRKQFELENHQIFDGSIPRNIEVGFLYTANPE